MGGTYQGQYEQQTERRRIIEDYRNDTNGHLVMGCPFCVGEKHVPNSNVIGCEGEELYCSPVSCLKGSLISIIVISCYSVICAS